MQRLKLDRLFAKKKNLKRSGLLPKQSKNVWPERERKPESHGEWVRKKMYMSMLFTLNLVEWLLHKYLRIIG